MEPSPHKRKGKEVTTKLAELLREYKLGKEVE